jgi:hypothetical protein
LNSELTLFEIRSFNKRHVCLILIPNDLPASRLTRILLPAVGSFRITRQSTSLPEAASPCEKSRSKPAPCDYLLLVDRKALGVVPDQIRTVLSTYRVFRDYLTEHQM